MLLPTNHFVTPYLSIQTDRDRYNIAFGDNVLVLFDIISVADICESNQISGINVIQVDL